MTTAIDTPRGRFYPWGRDKFTSVTTIIGEGVPKPGLNNWKIRTVAELAAKNRVELSAMTEVDAKEWLMSQRLFGGEAASSLGSALHSIFDDIVRGVRRNDTELTAPYVQSFRQFIEEHKPEYVETEATVYSQKYGYAGTLDFICILDGEVVIGDYKTGKSVWPEAALQISAYRYADFIGRADGREDKLPNCDRSVVLHVRPDGYRLVPVDSGPRVFDSFLSALDVYRWTTVESKDVIGWTG